MQIDIKLIYKELQEMNKRLKKIEKSINELRSPVMSIDSSPYKVKSYKVTLVYILLYSSP